MVSRSALPRHNKSARSATFLEPGEYPASDAVPETEPPELDLVVVPHWASPQARTAGLTPREWEVLTLLIVGYSTKDIAAHLQVSYHTAVRHIARIRSKFGVTSRAQVVARALGIVLPTPPEIRRPATAPTRPRK